MDPLEYAFPWTSRKEMEHLLSSVGVDMRTRGAPVDVATSHVHLGTGEVLFYLGRYIADEDDMEPFQTNVWIRQQATLAAALLLTGYKGEPLNETLEKRWDKAEEKLMLVMERGAEIPGYHPARPLGGAPVIVNPRVDMQRLPFLRRIRQTSTDKPAPGYLPPADTPTGLRYFG